VQETLQAGAEAGAETDQELQEMIVQCMGGFFKVFGSEFLHVYTSSPVAKTYMSWLVRPTSAGHAVLP
jgi:hypothetical protein